jgi:hypothetical protein
VSPPAVVDTNVLLVASGAHARAGQKCIESCAEVLEQFFEDRLRLVLDRSQEILREYESNVDWQGQPSMAKEFLKWIYTNQANDSRIDQVELTPVAAERRYQEFPDHDGLTSFDRSDRKFVAVAAAHHERPPIYQATDSKWVGWQSALNASGIEVRFVCAQQIRAVYQKKMGKKRKSTSGKSKGKKP